MVQSSIAGQPGHGALDDPSAAAKPLAGLDSLAGDTDPDAPAPEPSPQVRDVVRLVGMQADRFGLGRVGFVSHVEMGQHRLQCLVVVGVGRGEPDA